MKNKIKAVLFDIDGVLLNPNIKFSKAYCKEYDITPEEMSVFFNERFRYCSIGKADLKVELAKVMKDWKWDKSVEELMDYWFNHQLNFDNQLIDYIDNLNKIGKKSFVASDQEQYRGTFLTDKLNNITFFKKYYFSYMIGTRKNDIEYFKYIISDTNIDPNKIIFWDDSKTNIETAKKVGINAFHYTNFDDFQNTMKEYIPQL